MAKGEEKIDIWADDTLGKVLVDLWGKLKQSAEKGQKRWIQKWEWMEAGSGGEMWRDCRAWGKGRNEQAREMKKE